jgi:thiosulfate/3-mercaptopyruvate sulfurtransferase
MVESFSHFISADKLLEIHSEVTILDCSVDPTTD